MESPKVELVFVTPDAERLIETVGRTAYLSFDRQGEGTEKRFIRMLIKNRHLSVLEHAYATFRISGVSRAFTHQLVRHRLCSFIQQSQRYVDESHFGYVEPDSIREDPQAHSLFVNFMERAREVYGELKRLRIRNEDARYVLPNAVGSQIVVSANFREWRHIIALRGQLQSQWEIRRTVIEILKILKDCAPTVFGDFEIDEAQGVVKEVG